jgi:parvulin-like peptidyl-prolyl isomerase
MKTSISKDYMFPVLQVGEDVITSEQLIELLAQYQIVPQVVKELVIDETLAEIKCGKEEEKLACEQLAQQYELTSEEKRLLWLQKAGLTSEQFDNIAIRQLKLEKFKQITWARDLEAYFRQRKPQLDRVVYSLLRTNEIGIAQELYFRIAEGEESFSLLAREYTQGQEVDTDGLVGPVELQSIHPTMAKILSSVQPHQLVPPTQIGEWIVLIRLEKLLPAQFDAQMRQRLVNERFNTWLQEQIQMKKWQILPG